MHLLLAIAGQLHDQLHGQLHGQLHDQLFSQLPELAKHCLPGQDHQLSCELEYLCPQKLPHVVTDRAAEFAKSVARSSKLGNLIGNSTFFHAAYSKPYL